MLSYSVHSDIHNVNPVKICIVKTNNIEGEIKKMFYLLFTLLL